MRKHPGGKVKTAFMDAQESTLYPSLYLSRIRNGKSLGRPALRENPGQMSFSPRFTIHQPMVLLSRLLL